MRGSSPRKSVIVLAVATVAMLLAGCSGGGSGASSGGPVTPGVSGPATVEISISAADVTGSAAPLVPVGGSTTVPSTETGYLWPDQVDPRIKHVYMDVVKVSLMPADEAFDSGDMVGDIQNGNSPDPAAPPDKKGFITSVVDPPVRIDLLNLENGKKLARLLNRFDQVPAGTYDKVRVYYKNVQVIVDGQTDPMWFHPTANSKFDIHFRQGYELLIPVASDTTQKPDGWVKFYRVKLDVVGLKIMIVGGGKNPKGSKVILRPQIFAEADSDILYSVAGTVGDVTANDDNTAQIPGSCNISFGTGSDSRTIPVAFNGGTTWAYSDNVLGWSSWIVTESIPSPADEPVFRNGAKAMAIGAFDPSLTLQASDIVFSFPAVRDGVADNVWLAPDNVAFVLHSAGDNVTVFPKPSRIGAYYDNLALPHNRLDDTYLDNTLLVRARGYFSGPDLHAYWISIGGVAP